MVITESEGSPGTITELIPLLHQAFQKGSDFHPRTEKTVDPSFWISQWMEALFEASPSINRFTADRCAFHLKNARLCAASGDVPESCRHFARARTACETQGIRQELVLFLKAQMSAAEAYLDYTCRDYLQAIARLRETLAFDAILESDFNCRLAFGNRLHIVNNIIRVKGMAGELAGALTLASEVARYLDGQTETVTGFWSGPFREGLAPGMLEHSTGQLLSEVGMLLATLNYEIAGAAAECFVEDWGVVKASEKWLGQIREWLRLKRLFSRFERAESYLTSSLVFMEKGQGEWPLLWYLAALDAGAVSELADRRNGHTFRAEVLNAIDRCKYLPGVFKSGKLRVPDAWRPLASSDGS